MLTVAKLFPEQTNAQGDAENADALVRLLGWAGVAAESRNVDVLSGALPRAEIFVLGDVPPSDMDMVRTGLLRIKDSLLASISEGAVALVIGSAMGLATEIGLLSGSVHELPQRVMGDLVILASDSTTLWGFENQSTGYDCGKNERPLGAVVRGAGNGNSTEGARASIGAGLVIATHMHGPVVVRNFEIANEILEHVLKGKSFAVTHPDGIRAVALSRKLRESRLAVLDS